MTEVIVDVEVVDSALELPILSQHGIMKPSIHL